MKEISKTEGNAKEDGALHEFNTERYGDYEQIFYFMGFIILWK